MCPILHWCCFIDSRGDPVDLLLAREDFGGSFFPLEFLVSSAVTLGSEAASVRFRKVRLDDGDSPSEDTGKALEIRLERRSFGDIVC